MPRECCAEKESHLCMVCGIQAASVAGYCAECDIIEHAIRTNFSPQSRAEIVGMLERRKHRNPTHVPSSWMAL